MRLVDIMILVATVLGIAFPAYLIKAIRSVDEDAASDSTTKASIIFGALVFIGLVVVNSQ